MTPTFATCALLIALRSQVEAASTADDDEADRKFKAGMVIQSPPFPPESVEPQQILDPAEAERTLAVLDEELLIGVTIGGETRAYPIKYLALSEALNDELGGVPVVITWCMMCQAAIV